ncbi:hypothetical protein B0H14DRAFT_2575390 [Mycena olivaceomarginata]|nr:hypothetical protein B0H14DRAFT_2575390 [Mycena olivaceomarginata]
MSSATRSRFALAGAVAGYAPAYLAEGYALPVAGGMYGFFLNACAACSCACACKGYARCCARRWLYSAAAWYTRCPLGCDGTSPPYGRFGSAVPPLPRTRTAGLAAKGRRAGSYKSAMEGKNAPDQQRTTQECRRKLTRRWNR